MESQPEKFDWIARFDLDKTYLRSDFETLSDLVGNILERPDQKRPVPGASILLHEIRASHARLHVLSGSPEQMRSSITSRLRIDGVNLDELTLKPNLQNLLTFRFRALKDQLGYKLGALFKTSLTETRQGFCARRELLVGDDSEADAFVYCLYADVRQGRIDLEMLARVLEEGELYDRDRKQTLELAREAYATASDEHFLILIHLDRQTPPSKFAPFGPRVVPFFNYAQAALVLLDQGLLDADAAHRIGATLIAEHRFDLEGLARSYWDLRRRETVSPNLLGRLQPGAENAPAHVSGWSKAIVEDPLEAQPTPIPVGRTPLDYLALARHHRGGRNRS